MSKTQTRKSVSLSGAMFSAMRERSRSLGMSMSEYVHGLAAYDLETAGIVPPSHCAQGANTNKSHGPAPVDWDAVELPKHAPIAAAREAGEPVRVFKPVQHDPFVAPEPEAVQAQAPITPERPDLHCEWCGSVAGPKRPLGDHGMHADCATERTRVESRTEQRRRLA